MFRRRIVGGKNAAAAALFVLTGLAVQAASAQQVRVAKKFYPTGNEAGSVIMLERTTPTSARVGEPFEYTLRLTNLTNTEIEGVTLSEEFAANFQSTSIDPQPSSTEGARSIWNIGNMAPKSTTTIRFNGSASAIGSLKPCAEVTFKTGMCSEMPIEQPALQLVKTAPAEVMICDPIPVQLVVSNTGTGTARNVVVMDTLPEGWTTEDGKREVSLQAGDLAGGASREFRLTMKASATGSFTNSANATEDGGLTAQASSTTRITQPVLTLTKSGPTERYIGRTAEFTISVSNTGDAPARDAVLTDMVPAGTQFVEASEGGQLRGNAVNWSLGTIEPGASRQVTVKVNPTQRGEICNQATVRAYCAQAEGQYCLPIKGIPAILLEVVDVEDPIEVNANVTYIITVLNQGSADGTNIVISCTLPNEETYVSADGPTAGSNQGQVVTFAPLPSLAPKQSVKYHVVTKGIGVGDVRFSTSLSSDQLEQSVDETESTHIY